MNFAFIIVSLMSKQVLFVCVFLQNAQPFIIVIVGFLLVSARALPLVNNVVWFAWFGTYVGSRVSAAKQWRVINNIYI